MFCGLKPKTEFSSLEIGILKGDYGCYDKRMVTMGKNSEISNARSTKSTVIFAQQIF